MVRQFQGEKFLSTAKENCNLQVLKTLVLSVIHQRMTTKLDKYSGCMKCSAKIYYIRSYVHQVWNNAVLEYG